MKVFLDVPGAYVAGDRMTRGVKWAFDPPATIHPDGLLALTRRFLAALERCNTHVRM